MVKFLKAAPIAALSLLAGCSSGPSYEYYKVSSRFVSSAQNQSAPEIITTPGYGQYAGRALTVAVRAPDRCSNNTANQASGGAAASGAILQTNCGVEMAEIERGLTRAGYNVISWNILEREMARNSSANEVASTLGAQVLFQINSLENSRKTLGQDARWERTYARSDPRGMTGAPLPLTEETRNMIGRTYLAPIEAKANTRAYAVTLDAVAVWVATGQSLWYYRWTRAKEPNGTAVGYNLPLQCIAGYGFSQCSQFRPVGAQAQASTVVAAGESVAISASERPEDVEKAIYAELYKEVVQNFVDSFAKARQFAS
ncbi:hypothetical protein PQ455_00870 [Sphingomonas naphthae]|uniref:Uncharacterized protein n=1 Tax=Sphingomonas naphthae TaxID=1813468 RepID=A0ABY7TLJ0_9SPHN|nr:hypothetical protein [Sphingomonas naphthae]WCT73815.1 hypothetical protein PQ455_00870 [Sphingomonas naphthae]